MGVSTPMNSSMYRGKEHIMKTLRFLLTVMILALSVVAFVYA